MINTINGHSIYGTGDGHPKNLPSDYIDENGDCTISICKNCLAVENDLLDNPCKKIPVDVEIGKNTADILIGMIETYNERGKLYGNTFTRTRDVVRALFPDGVSPELVDKTQWHIFEMVINKLVRFANTNLEHVDSIHDAAVYCAIIEEVMTNKGKYKW